MDGENNGKPNIIGWFGGTPIFLNSQTVSNHPLYFMKRPFGRDDPPTFPHTH